MSAANSAILYFVVSINWKKRKLITLEFHDKFSRESQVNILHNIMEHISWEYKLMLKTCIYKLELVNENL